MMVQGASRGIGLELVRQQLARGERVVATCRTPERATALHELADGEQQLQILQLDLSREDTIERAARAVQQHVDELSLLVNAAGLLHDGALQPEKKLAQVSPKHLQRVFEVNAFGPLLVTKHFAPLLVHGKRAVLANLSARVGSIEDNRLGGWYAYRASKCAQNMFTRNAAIELARRSREIIVVALHPGTVDTNLSQPFQRNVPPHKLFDVSRAAAQLLHVIDNLDRDSNGHFFAYDGSHIPW